MALVKIDSPSDAPVAIADWYKINAVLQTIGNGMGGGSRVIGSTFPRGAVLFYAGAWYIADADTAITGTASKYVKVTNTAGVLSLSFVADITGVTWNKQYQGYYDALGNMYLFDEFSAYADGYITDINTIINWRPSNAETSKILSQLNASGWAAFMASTPVTTGKTYALNATGSATSKTYSSSRVLSRVTTYEPTVFNSTFTLKTERGVVFNATSLVFAYSGLTASIVIKDELNNTLWSGTGNNFNTAFNYVKTVDGGTKTITITATVEHTGTSNLSITGFGVFSDSILDTVCMLSAGTVIS